MYHSSLKHMGWVVGGRAYWQRKADSLTYVNVYWPIVYFYVLFLFNFLIFYLMVKGAVG